MKKENFENVIAIRLKTSTKKQIEKVRKHLQKNAPNGIIIKQSDVIRYLINQGLKNFNKKN